MLGTIRSFTPILYTDPNGEEIRLQSHYVFRVGGPEHASLKIIPNDQAHYRNNPLFQQGKEGKVFMTLGAGPEINSPLNWGHVTAAPNRDRDVNASKTSSVVLSLPSDMKSENQMIDNLIKSGENFDNHKTDYGTIFGLQGDFNSNSYLHGLLNANGYTEKEGVPSSMPNNPKWDKAVPNDAFQPGPKVDLKKAHPPIPTPEERRRDKQLEQ